MLALGEFVRSAHIAYFTMEIGLERLQPEEDHLPADGKSLVWYRIVAKYLDGVNEGSSRCRTRWRRSSRRPPTWS